MKFLVLALFVCVANAAVPQWQKVGQLGVQTLAVPSAAGQLGAKTVAVASANSVGSVASDVAAPILKLNSDVNADSFQWEYETGNGISASASGSLKNVDKVDALVMQGSYHYVAPDGTPVNVQYVADENGYQPSSDLLPVGPPVPEAILRSLEYIRTHPPKE